MCCTRLANDPPRALLFRVPHFRNGESDGASDFSRCFRGITVGNSCEKVSRCVAKKLGGTDRFLAHWSLRSLKSSQGHGVAASTSIDSHNRFAVVTSSVDFVATSKCKQCVAYGPRIVPAAMPSVRESHAHSRLYALGRA